jgi:hypothetical protein
MNAHRLSISWRSALVPTLGFFVALACPAVAHAEGDNEAAETAAARTLAVDGVKLAQSDKCSEAVDKLERAEKLKHSPIVLRYLGECQVKVGRWVEGSESLRKLLREPLPENASPALTTAYEGAAATLRDVKPRIPSMKITLDAPADTQFTIKVDGKELAASAVGVALPADPGEHTIEATAPGFLKASTSVKLQASSAAMVALELKRDPNAPLPSKTPPAAHAAPPTNTPASVAPAASPPQPATHGSSTGKVLGYVSYAVAAGGLGVGIAFGQSAMNDEKTLRANCPNKVCTSEQEDALEFAKTKGTIATIGFAVAGGGAALGTILLLTSGSSSSESAQKSPPKRTATFSRPRAQIGAGNVTFAADF